MYASRSLWCRLRRRRTLRARALRVLAWGSLSSLLVGSLAGLVFPGPAPRALEGPARAPRLVDALRARQDHYFDYDQRRLVHQRLPQHIDTLRDEFLARRLGGVANGLATVPPPQRNGAL